MEIGSIDEIFYDGEVLVQSKVLGHRELPEQLESSLAQILEIPETLLERWRCKKMVFTQFWFPWELPFSSGDCIPKYFHHFYRQNNCVETDIMLLYLLY